MASKRSIPTNLFWDETFSELSSDAQSVFLGLLLGADDHGRGLANSKSVARMLAKTPDLIEAALKVLQESQFIQCYQVEGKRYYHIRAWDEWERLDHRARSCYPPPPETPLLPVSENPPEIAGNPGGFSESPGNRGESRPEEKRSRREVKKKRREGEEEGTPTPGVVIPFPARAGGGQEETGATMIQDLACRLHIPVTPALSRLVTEFQGKPGLSLLGEADAARAWLDEPRQRKKGTQMSLPFFRRWLQRACQIQTQQAEAAASLSQEPLRATGTTGSGPARLPSLMHLDDDIQPGGTRS